MTRPFKIHDDFSELEFPADSSFDELCEKITHSAFGESLLFALVETTTISNVSGVGTTQYISYKPYDYIQNTIQEDYKAIIDLMKGYKLGSPVKYYHWYKRSQYYCVIGSNDGAPPPPQMLLLQPHKIDPGPKGSAEEYIIDYPTPLTGEWIRDFVEKYVQCFLTKDWFKELPHYFLLVKPVSIKDEVDLYIPLGNIYLVVGTSRQIEVADYKKYVSQLQAAWFNKFGGRLLKEFSTKRISDEYKPKILDCGTLANSLKKPLFNYDGKEFTLNDFYYYAFDSDAYVHLKERYLLNADHKFIDDLIQHTGDNKRIVEIIGAWHNQKDYEYNFLNCTANGGLKTFDENSVKYFLRLLSKRRLALALLLVFDFSLEETHLALVFGDKRKSKENYDRKDHTSFLSSNLFIMQPHPKEKMLPLLADRDKVFLTKIVEKIRRTTPSFTCKLPV
ncbi:MAG TPA: hypothetical protein PLL77_16075 [Pyrinomonadaceae bacterium]|nr:hypothetical protein [Pyrinomonadaceae bacterium]